MRNIFKNAREYVEYYYAAYATGKVDEEIQATGEFLLERASGRVLDCGCGPVPQLWAIFMPKMTELYAIDLPQESIDFVQKKIVIVHEWENNFTNYKNIVEEEIGSLPDNYILQQVSKIKSVMQADMTENIPFSANFFDTVLSLYSLGCLKNENELQSAVKNIANVLRQGGVFLHVNTNGENKNDVLPAYTWNGLDQSSVVLENLLKKEGFTVSQKEVKLPRNEERMYSYDALSLLCATKLATS